MEKQSKMTDALTTQMASLTISLPSSAHEQNFMPTPRLEIQVPTDAELDDWIEVWRHHMTDNHDKYTTTTLRTLQTKDAKSAKAQFYGAQTRLDMLREVRRVPQELRVGKPWRTEWEGRRDFMEAECLRMRDEMARAKAEGKPQRGQQDLREKQARLDAVRAMLEAY